MSLRYEQYRALFYTRQFFCDCLDPEKRPKTVRELRKQVLRCWRHFPPLMEDGEPIFSNDSMEPPGRPALAQDDVSWRRVGMLEGLLEGVLLRPDVPQDVKNKIKAALRREGGK